MNKTVQYVIRVGRGVCAVVSATAALVFVVISFWGGFRIYFPIATLSVTDPERAFLLALVFGGYA